MKPLSEATKKQATTKHQRWFLRIQPSKRNRYIIVYDEQNEVSQKVTIRWTALLHIWLHLGVALHHPLPLIPTFCGGTSYIAAATKTYFVVLQHI